VARFKLGPLRFGGGRRISLTGGIGPIGITVGGRRKRKSSFGSYNDSSNDVDSSVFNDGIDRSLSAEELRNKLISKSEWLNKLYLRHVNILVSLFVTLVSFVLIPGPTRFLGLFFGLLIYSWIAWRGAVAKAIVEYVEKTPNPESVMTKTILKPQIKSLHRSALIALTIIDVWAFFSQKSTQIVVFVAIVVAWALIRLSMSQHGKSWLKVGQILIWNYIWGKVWTTIIDSDEYLNLELPIWTSFFVLPVVLLLHFYPSRLLWRFGRMKYPKIDAFEENSKSGIAHFNPQDQGTNRLERGIKGATNVVDGLNDFIENATENAKSSLDKNRAPHRTSTVVTLFFRKLLYQRMIRKAREGLFKNFYNAAHGKDKNQIKALAESDEFRGFISLNDPGLDLEWKICSQELFNLLWETKINESVNEGKIINGYTIIPNADLVNANLVDADLSGMNLSGANLTCANLTGANLSGARLLNANLAMANLTRANLNNAKMVGANLSFATVTIQQLSSAVTNLATMPDGSIND